MRNRYPTVFLTIFAALCVNGCQLEFKPNLIPIIAFEFEIPFRFKPAIAKKYFPALKASKARNQMIDCIADRGEKNMVSNKCFLAFDHYREFCFPYSLSNVNSCKALYNVASMSGNIAALKELSYKSGGRFLPFPLINKSGRLMFLLIERG